MWPHRPNFSGVFDLCLHWVSVVRALGLEAHALTSKQTTNESGAVRGFRDLRANAM